MICEDNYISKSSVWKAARRIHEAGGCDARDEYSKGYDDAVTLALSILLEPNLPKKLYIGRSKRLT